MHHNLNKNNNNNNDNRLIASTASTAATIFTLAIMSASFMVTPAAASTNNNNTTSTTTTSPSAELIELSPQPIWQEQQISVSDTPINNTHTVITFTGNGTLTLPNTTESISTTSNSTALIEFMTNSGQKKETIRTEDGQTITATSYEIANFNPATGEGKGIMITVFNTNSTGTLAPLNGMILAGIHDIQPTPLQSFTFSEWQSGIPLPTTTTTIMEEPPLMNTTTMTETNATTTTSTATSDTNTTATSPEGQGEGEQQETTPTLGPNLLFE